VVEAGRRNDRRLNKHKDAVEAYARAVDRYAQSGFLVQAIAVCKVILQLEPEERSRCAGSRR
jgi:hypothetical protein